jgi:ribosomal protein S12 methylthiotransferase
LSIKIGMVSLGCAKNAVDAEVMLGALVDSGCEITPDAEAADIIIVNTCGFIDAAKRESIEAILDMAKMKQTGRCKRLIVSGCLSERYIKDLPELMPEVDAFLGVGQSAGIADIIKEVEEGRRVIESGLPDTHYNAMKRVLTTPWYTAYVKIAEGCDNCCTYCAIPSIRGGYVSAPEEDVLSELERLAEAGVKEAVLVAQDTTRYGEDIYGERRLADLLEKACEIDGIDWLRVLYCYPERVDKRLLDVMARQPKILKYIDLPMQHADNGILKAMNRANTRESMQRLMDDIRGYDCGFVVRTSLISGFPGEDEKAHEALLEFIKHNRIERIGAFEFSREEGTPAYSMPQVHWKTKKRRHRAVMELAREISREFNSSRVGDEVMVLCEGFDEERGLFYGRSFAEAPDADGKVYFTAKEFTPGEFTRVRILSAGDYDITGEADL